MGFSVHGIIDNGICFYRCKKKMLADESFDVDMIMFSPVQWDVPAGIDRFSSDVGHILGSI